LPAPRPFQSGKPSQVRSIILEKAQAKEEKED